MVSKQRIRVVLHGPMERALGWASTQTLSTVRCTFFKKYLHTSHQSGWNQTRFGLLADKCAGTPYGKTGLCQLPEGDSLFHAHKGTGGRCSKNFSIQDLFFPPEVCTGTIDKLCGYNGPAVTGSANTFQENPTYNHIGGRTRWQKSKENICFPKPWIAGCCPFECDTGDIIAPKGSSCLLPLYAGACPPGSPGDPGLGNPVDPVYPPPTTSGSGATEFPRPTQDADDPGDDYGDDFGDGDEFDDEND